MHRVTAENLQTAIDAYVSPYATLMTDDHYAYKVVAENTDRFHKSVNHRKGEYVRGRVHSNTVEVFFSILKRGINGTFHHVSRGHLGRYCDEFAFRYENRKATDGERANLVVAGAERISPDDTRTTGHGWPNGTIVRRHCQGPNYRRFP